MSDTGMTSANWRKSSRSGDQNCVEVADSAGTIKVRDSKDVEGPILTFPTAGWATFLYAAKAGEFDQ